MGNHKIDAGIGLHEEYVGRTAVVVRVCAEETVLFLDTYLGPLADKHDAVPDVVMPGMGPNR